MGEYMQRHPAWSVVLTFLAAVLLWAIFAPWPDGLEEVFGRKRIFLNASSRVSPWADSTSSWPAASR